MGGLLTFSLDQKPLRLVAREGTYRIPLRFFDEQQAQVIAAAAARILPSDESGPGATEAGVVIYIDRQLAGPYGRDRYRYTHGPFEAGPEEFGYQGKATPRDIYRAGLKLLAGFDRLEPAQQDQRLQELESSRFFLLLRQHSMEGMFCDPMHGGNIDMLGWQLIGFPGPQMSYYDEIEKHFGRAFRPPPVRLAGGQPMEDEQ